MKISVVMATFNGEKYILEQLDSIRLQTLKPDEVLISDDGSSDKTVSLVKEFISQNGLENWQVTENESNVGYAGNFNLLLNEASGELIFMSDQDDVWDLDKIQKMAEFMDFHSDCNVLASDYIPWCPDKVDYEPPRDVMERMPGNGKIEKLTLSDKSPYIGAIGCAMCVRSDFLKKIKDFWFYNWAQDDRLWRLSQCTDGLYLWHDNMIKHRIHANNTSTFGNYHDRNKRIAHFKEMLQASEQMLELLNKEGADKRKIKIASAHCKMLELRIGLLEHKKIANIFRLLPYIKYYQKPTSYPLDIVIMLK